MTPITVIGPLPDNPLAKVTPLTALRQPSLNVRPNDLAITDTRAHPGEEEREPMYTVLLVILVLLVIGALPTWGYSGSWGYGPSGGLGLIVLILIVLLVTGRL